DSRCTLDTSAVMKSSSSNDSVPPQRTEGFPAVDTVGNCQSCHLSSWNLQSTLAGPPLPDSDGQEWSLRNHHSPGIRRLAPDLRRSPTWSPTFRGPLRDHSLPHQWSGDCNVTPAHMHSQNARRW
ncbi:hypothetical protein GOP47_0009987, partial [Adiantum capillus-veneris]